MKKLFLFIAVALFIMSSSGTVYATTGEVSSVTTEYLGTFPLSTADNDSSMKFYSAESNICENEVKHASFIAEEIPGNHVLSDLDFISETGIIPYATTSFSFNGLAGGSCASNWVSYTLDDSGDAILHVSACTWIPSDYEIVIGLWQVGTGKLYGVKYSNTNVTDVNIRTINVPAGTYYVVVKNNEASNMIINNGILSYSLS